jgi:hypothetical protein
VQLCQQPAHAAALAEGRKLERQHRLHVEGSKDLLQEWVVQEFAPGTPTEQKIMRHKAKSLTTSAIRAARVECCLAFGKKYAHVREATGQNDGWQIEVWQKMGGGRKGWPWCGYYELARQYECDLPFPTEAGASKSWFRPTSWRTTYIRHVRGSIDSLKVGYKIGVYYPHLRRIGHIGTNIGPGRSIRAGRRAATTSTRAIPAGAGAAKARA